MKSFKYSLRKYATPIVLIAFVGYLVALAATLSSSPLSFELHFLIITAALLGGLVLYVILCALLLNFSLVQLSGDMIYSSNLWSRRECSWSDIAKVEINRVSFLYYLNLYNENGDIIMSIPHKWMAKQDEFETTIRDYTSVDHPLREFLS